MKRKRNHSFRSSVFIFLAALFLLFTCSVSTIYASTLQKPIILTNSDTAGAAGIRSKAKIIISEPDLRDI